MCGIAGIIDLHGTRDIDRRLVDKMMDAMQHRGPDGKGIHVEPGLAFGHRRLAIVDLAGGIQPFTSSTGKTVLTYNGEIYNHRAIAKDLAKEGRTLTTRSDTEVLAELVDLRGADALADLNGMFAFAAWSPRDNSFLLARDRLGEKPLYYHQTRDGFLVFASEFDALMAAGLAPDQIDPSAVADYLFYGYVPDPKTIYSEVYKLPPGHYLKFQRGGPLRPARPWWSLTQRPEDQLTFEDAQAELVTLLDRAVSDQMMADVPLAAFLSGGVDSSAIVSAMAQSGNDKITTCAMGFDDPSYDERNPARTVAQLFGTQHQEQVVDVDNASLLPVIASVYGEPFADTSALPTLLLCQLARKHATVALSGDGGDEIFAGYERYQGILREAQVRDMIPGPLRTGLVAPLGQLYPPLFGAPHPFRLRTALQSIGESQGAGYARAVSAVVPDRCAALLSGQMADYRPQTLIEAAIDKADTDDPVLQAQAADLATWLPGRMLVKVDRASMANSLEVRPPLLDHRLVEWAARLPRQFKVKGNNGKHVFKAALEPRLPDAILYRRKQGFGAPVDRWFRDAGGTLLADLRGRRAWKDSGYFDVDHVLKTATRHEKGQAHHGQELWSVLMFDAFLTRQSADRSRFIAGEMTDRGSS